MDRSRLMDCAFLFGAVLLSALPYVFGLGFYSDDWNYQAVLVRSSHLGIGSMFWELARADSGMVARPVQLAYLVLGFKAFGQYATAYHLFNSVLLGLLGGLIYLVIRELGGERWPAFSIALVFGVLPHYATDRFWISAHQVTLSMAFALFGIYALVRSSRPQARWMAWATVAAIALVLSILAYEVALGLIVALLGWIGWSTYKDARNSSRHRVEHLSGVVGTAAVLLIIGILKFRAQRRIALPHHYANFLMRFPELSGHALVQAFRFNFWTYGLHAPAVLMGLDRHAALSRNAIACAMVIALGVSAYMWRKGGSGPTCRSCLWLLLMGLVLFWLGFVLFFPSAASNFSTAGLDNRVAMASALGASCVLVAMAGLASLLLGSWRKPAYCVLIGVVCGVECLIVNGLGWFWVDAASRQSAILKDVAADVRTLPDGSVLLLDGFCGYSGPAVVFETDWDTTPAIQMALGNSSLRGDVVSRNLTLDDVAIKTSIYGDAEGHYSYGNRLFVYNARLHSVTDLPSRSAAERYFRGVNPNRDSDCPPSREGVGARAF
ncbi:MAG TPA: hypothetical protein VGI45_11460 [Terracidiphilus sp.]